MLNIVCPISGKAQRFIDAGYNIPKFLVRCGKYQVIDLAMDSIDVEFNRDYRLIFLVRLDHIYNHHLDEVLKKKFAHYNSTFSDGNVVVIPVDKITEGAPCTCLLADEYIDNRDPLIIFTPDITFYPSFNYEDINEDLDGLLLTFKANSPAHSYVLTDEKESVVKVAEKQVISQFANIGLYYYKQGQDFVRAARKMISANDRINNEFYIAPTYNYLISEGKKIGHQLVEKTYCLGTPQDVEFYNRYISIHDEIKTVGLVCDHSGFEVKEKLKYLLENRFGLDTIDFGAYTTKSSDYSDYVPLLTKAINDGVCQIGFGACASGQGVNICAAKQPGIYPALIYNKHAAKMAIQHNCANFFSFNSLLSDDDLFVCISEILHNRFAGGRHATRIQKIG